MTLRCKSKTVSYAVDIENSRIDIFETSSHSRPRTNHHTRTIILLEFPLLATLMLVASYDLIDIMGKTSTPLTRLFARKYGPSEYSPKIRVIGSILSAVTSVVRISMQCAVHACSTYTCLNGTVLPHPRHGVRGSVRGAFST